MSDFTFEVSTKEQGNYETFEWDNLWISHANEPERKRVLYIGDSISCGTRNIATERTNDEILFDGFGTSKGIDNPFFSMSVSLFAKQESRRDAVIFNNGLHGWHLDDTTEYAEHYEKIVQFLLEEFKGTPLFLILSTHVENEETEKRVILRNEAVKKIAKKYNLPIIDLYTVSLNSNALQSDGVHFQTKGYELLADEIITALKSEI